MNQIGQFEIAFADPRLDRAAHLRGDAGALEGLRARADARMVLLWRGRICLADAAQAMQGGAAHLLRLPPDHPALGTTSAELFLGHDPDTGAPLFAAELSDWQGAAAPDDRAFIDTAIQSHPDLPAAAGFAEMRGLLLALAPLDAETAATARSLFEWHRSHAFCARCGTASHATMAGWQRQCPACNSPHFPRVDPVVIMGVTRDDAILLGRGNGWPEGMYSCLAGFMEPGETLEAAVAREVLEETGIHIDRASVRCVATQPWPYPSSLMLGCMAHATSDAITVDPAEIEDAQWVTRDRLACIFAGEDPVIRAPRKGAIAGWLIAEWLAQRSK